MQCFVTDWLDRNNDFDYFEHIGTFVLQMQNLYCFFVMAEEKSDSQAKILFFIATCVQTFWLIFVLGETFF